jgi:hypothetical protein
LDYSYISQFSSNFVAYLMTEKDNISAQLKASQYEAELPTNVLENCLHKFQTETDFCDQGECKKKSCPSQADIENQLNAVITNKWETGQIYGDMIANLFGATLDAPA